MSAISTIRNLGPASEEAFKRAGITTAEEIQNMGADAAYLALLESGSRPHFIGYYVLVMGLQGRGWNDLDPKEKAKLRKQFDALVKASKAKSRPDIEAALDRIGTGKRR